MELQSGLAFGKARGQCPPEMKVNAFWTSNSALGIHPGKILTRMHEDIRKLMSLWGLIYLIRNSKKLKLPKCSSLRE